MALHVAVNESIPVNFLHSFKKEKNKDLLQLGEIMEYLVERPFVIIDCAGVIVYCNSNLINFLGLLGADEIIGKKYLNFCHLFDTEIKQCRLLDTLKTGKNYRAEVTNAFKKMVPEGTTLLVDSFVLKDDDDTIAGAIGIFEDGSINKRVTELFYQSEKLASLGQLAAGLAHEIRNPLTSVRGFVQLMQTKMSDNGYSQIVLQEIDRVNNLIKEFLQMARPVVKDRNRVSFYELVQQVITFMQAEAILRGVQVVFISHEDCEVLINEEHMKQVLINILQNAFEAMSDGGKVVLDVKITANNVVLTINDEGPGFSEEVLSKIYEPFFTTKENGSGLGLAISKQIVEEQGGALHAANNPAGGAVFTITLPLKND